MYFYKVVYTLGETLGHAKYALYAPTYPQNHIVKCSIRLHLTESLEYELCILHLA